MRIFSGARALPVLLLTGFVAAGCASAPQYGETHRSKFRAGRPNYTVAAYQVNGVWYYPKVDYGYDETGTASWYGEQFNHRPTSDGEIFDMNELSAAHKTLPLPSVVAVTNMQNGRELRLRVNDRGPFVGDRLIDVSRRAAQLLGFERSGTAPVRVRILREDSIQVAAAAMRGEVGPVGVAEASQATRTEVAALPPPAPPPRLETLPPVQVAETPVYAPPAAAPPPVSYAPQPYQPPRRETPAPMQLAEVVAPPVPYSPPSYAPPPRSYAAPVATAAAEPLQQRPPPARSRWPSLIAPAHAETFHMLTPPPPHRPTPGPARAGSRIFIQAGAFAVPENAQRVRARIAGLGPVVVVTTASRGTPLYQVRLGPLASEAEAERMLHKVVDHGYRDARVVAE